MDAQTLKSFLNRDTLDAVFRNLGMVTAGVGVAYSFIRILGYGLVPRGYIQPSKDKAILVTGCDSGFGRGTAVNLARKGFTVYAACLFDSSLQGLQSEGGSNIKPVQMDVTKPGQVDRVVSQISKETGGRLQAVINNAGISRGFIVEFTPMEEFRKCFEVNYFGLVDVTKKVLPMIQRAKGTVVNVSSLRGHVCAPGMAAYSSTKYAVQAFSDTLRVEMLPFDVKVVLIEPGFINTTLVVAGLEQSKDIVRAADPKVSEKYGGDRLIRDLDDSRKIINVIQGEPVIIVNAMTDAVMARNPYPRYMLPRHARVLMRMRWLLPEYFMDLVSVILP
eukprot:Clim_evm10s156 gene=Clim_evmTU10s156